MREVARISAGVGGGGRRLAINSASEKRGRNECEDGQRHLSVDVDCDVAIHRHV
jgi:hypothetical protein